MSVLVKFVAIVGFASIANAGHSCEDPVSGESVGDCLQGCSSGYQILDGHVDRVECDNEEIRLGQIGLRMCCGLIPSLPICPPCKSDCNENFFRVNDCITFEEYLNSLVVTR